MNSNHVVSSVEDVRERPMLTENRFIEDEEDQNYDTHINIGDNHHDDNLNSSNNFENHRATSSSSSSSSSSLQAQLQVLAPISKRNNHIIINSSIDSDDGKKKKKKNELTEIERKLLKEEVEREVDLLLKDINSELHTIGIENDDENSLDVIDSFASASKTMNSSAKMDKIEKHGFSSLTAATLASAMADSGRTAMANLSPSEIEAIEIQAIAKANVSAANVAKEIAIANEAVSKATTAAAVAEASVKATVIAAEKAAAESKLKEVEHMKKISELEKSKETDTHQHREKLQLFKNKVDQLKSKLVASMENNKEAERKIARLRMEMELLEIEIKDKEEKEMEEEAANKRNGHNYHGNNNINNHDNNNNNNNNNNNISNSNGNQSNVIQRLVTIANVEVNHEEVKKIQRQVQRQRALRDGFAALELAANDDDGAVSIYQDNQTLSYMKIFRLYYKYFLQALPLFQDTYNIEAQYGPGTGSFFYFFAWVTRLSMMLSIMWFALLMRFNNDSHSHGNAIGFIPDWMLISSFHTLPDRNNYLIFVFAFLIVILVASIAKLWTEDKVRRSIYYFDSDGSLMRFSRVALNCWDYSIADAKLAELQKISTAQKFLALMEDEEASAKYGRLTKAEWTAIYVKRVSGTALISMLLVSSWVMIIYLSIKNQAMVNYFDKHEYSLFRSMGSLIVPGTLSILNSLLPPIIKTTTHFECWINPFRALEMETVRLYAVMILSLGLVVFGLLQMVSNIVLVHGTVTPLSSGIPCALDQVGISLVNLMIGNFLANKFGDVIVILYTKALAVNPTPFDLPMEAINLIYSQTLFLLAAPYAPYTVPLGALLFWISFKWKYLMIKKFFAKSADPFRGSDTGAIFSLFYAVTLLLFIFWVYFLFNFVHSKCGPFQIGQTLWEEMMEAVVKLKESNVTSSMYKNVMLNPFALWLAILIVLIQNRFLKNELACLMDFHVDKYDIKLREVNSLSLSVNRLRTVIKHQKLLIAKELEIQENENEIQVFKNHRDTPEASDKDIDNQDDDDDVADYDENDDDGDDNNEDDDNYDEKQQYY